MRKIIVSLLLIIPLFCFSQDRTIHSNFNYTQIEKKVHNIWTITSSKFEDNKFLIDGTKIFWTSSNKSKQYDIEDKRLFEGNLIYVVRDFSEQIMVVKIIEDESISIIWLDQYSRRVSIVFEMLKH